MHSSKERSRQVEVYPRAAKRKSTAARRDFLRQGRRARCRTTYRWRFEQHFSERYFDVLYCNGVYGFGLDAAPHIERAVEMCWSRSRDGGYFIFWNDIPERIPVPLNAIVAYDSGAFRFPISIPGAT
jgi:hypothetical protein